jgi:hypothetical protein
MLRIKISNTYPLLLLPMLFCFSHQSAFADILSQFGFGYGREFRNNTDIEQYELFLREPLPYTNTLGNTNVFTSIEFGLALIRDSAASISGTTRFSIMPQVIFCPYEKFRFITGIGAGFMVGETDFFKKVIDSCIWLIIMTIIKKKDEELNITFWRRA